MMLSFFSMKAMSCHLRLQGVFLCEVQSSAELVDSKPVVIRDKGRFEVAEMQCHSFLPCSYILKLGKGAMFRSRGQMTLSQISERCRISGLDYHPLISIVQLDIILMLYSLSAN